MNKLTLRLDEKLIAAAKQRARAEGKSLSAMVADFFSMLAADDADSTHSTYGPLTTRLVGIMKDTEISIDDYKQHLDTKHT